MFKDEEEHDRAEKSSLFNFGTKSPLTHDDKHVSFLTDFAPDSKMDDEKGK